MDASRNPENPEAGNGKLSNIHGQLVPLRRQMLNQSHQHTFLYVIVFKTYGDLVLTIVLGGRHVITFIYKR